MTVSTTIHQVHCVNIIGLISVLIVKITIHVSPPKAISVPMQNTKGSKWNQRTIGCQIKSSLQNEISLLKSVQNTAFLAKLLKSLAIVCSHSWIPGACSVIYAILN